VRLARLSVKPLADMRDLLRILREHDLRIIVLAVVLGHAIASGIGALIHVIGNFAGMLIQGREIRESFPLAWKATLVTGPLNVILWLVVSVVTLFLIQKVIASKHDVG
jgi:hypothetical protein